MGSANIHITFRGPILQQGLVNVPFWGLVSHHLNKYLLEMKYPQELNWDINPNPCCSNNVLLVKIEGSVW